MGVCQSMHQQRGVHGLLLTMDMYSRAALLGFC